MTGRVSLGGERREVVSADSSHGRSRARGWRPAGGSRSSGSGGYLLRVFVPKIPSHSLGQRANDYFSRSASRCASQLCAVPSTIPLRNERRRSRTAGPGRVGGLGQGRAIRSRSRQTVEHGPPLEGSVGPETDPPVELHVPDLRAGHLAAARRPAPTRSGCAPPRSRSTRRSCARCG